MLPLQRTPPTRPRGGGGGGAFPEGGPVHGGEEAPLSPLQPRALPLQHQHSELKRARVAVDVERENANANENANAAGLRAAAGGATPTGASAAGSYVNCYEVNEAIRGAAEIGVVDVRVFALLLGLDSYRGPNPLWS